MEPSELLVLLQGAKERSEYLDYAIQRTFFAMAKPVPPYTGSLDAAALLLPPGWTIHRLSNLSDCKGGLSGWIADIFRPTDAVIPFPSEGTAMTAPLALCVAAVRTRLGMLLDGEEKVRHVAGR